MTQLNEAVAPTGPQAVTAPAVELFDPPLCCPTGLCGPNLDQTLLDVNEMVLALQARGIGVERYQLVGNPQAFLNHPEVLRLVHQRRLAVLPVTVVNGRIIKSGAYPTLEELLTALEGAVAAT